MNSTQRTLAIVAVTALLAAGFIGFAYAYTTQTDITENTAPSEYFLISSGDDVPTAKSYQEQFTSSVKYDTIVSYVTAEEATSAGHPEATHKVVYTLRPDTGAMTGSVYGMELSNLGSVKLNIATQDGAAPLYVDDTGTRVVGTYDIEVLIPADQLDEQLYYFAKAVETGSQTDDHEFAVADTNVDKFVEVTTGPDKGNYVAYLTVPDAESAYTVYIGASAKGDVPIVEYYEYLPTEPKLVLDDADITFRVNSDSLIAGGNSYLIDVRDNGEDEPVYVAEVVLNHAEVDDPDYTSGTIVSNVFVATLAYGNGALFVDGNDIFKVTTDGGTPGTKVTDTKVQYYVADHAIKNIAQLSGDAARDLGVNITLKDNRSAWMKDATNDGSVTSSNTDNLKITYNIPAIQLVAGDVDGVHYTFDMLVAPNGVTRTVVVPDINGPVTVEGGTGASFTTSASGSSQSLTVSVAASNATYTGTFDITLSTLTFKDSMTAAKVLITSNGTTSSNGFKKIEAAEDKGQITLLKSLDVNKVKAHKSSAWFVDAVASTVSGTSDAPVTVLALAKKVADDGTVTWYAADLPVSVYTATMTLANSVVKGQDTTASLTIETVDAEDLPAISYESSNTLVATISDAGVVTGVEVGNSVISLTFVYEGVNYVIEKTISVTAS